jgi:hypothetical protein
MKKMNNTLSNLKCQSHSHSLFHSFIISQRLSFSCFVNMSVSENGASPSGDCSGEIRSSGSGPQASASSSSAQPVIYCLDPALAGVKKAAAPDLLGIWEGLYTSIRGGGVRSVGDLQAAFRELFAGQGGLDGARLVSAMDANFLTSLFHLIGAGVDDAFADQYVSLVPGLDLSRKRVKELRSIFVRFINADLNEDQYALPLIVPDQGSGEEDEKDRLEDVDESARIGGGSGKNELITSPRRTPRRSVKPSKEGRKDAYSDGLSILDATVKRSGKSSRRSSTPDSDPSDSSTPSDSSDDDSDDASSKKKKKSKRAERKKKSKDRRSK